MNRPIETAVGSPGVCGSAPVSVSSGPESSIQTRNRVERSSLAAAMLATVTS